MSKEKIKCGTCDGKGYIRDYLGFSIHDITQCPICNGVKEIEINIEILDEDDGDIENE